MPHSQTTEAVAPLTDAQLGAYLVRIGLPRPARADFEALAAIHRAHLLSFTWEALDAFMGWPSSIDPQDAFAKMVARQRGGWCYEMNGLLGAALAALGFRVARLCGAVNRETLGDIVIGNHLTLRVDLEQPYLAEVGVADALIGPVPMKVGPIRQRGFDFSITRSDDGWLRFRNHQLGLARSFDFQTNRRDEAAMLAMHHWLSEAPASPFTRSLALFRHTPEGYVALQNDRLRRITPGMVEEQRITSVDQFADTLTATFGIAIPLPSEVWAKVVEVVAQSDAA
ncbi:MAG: arylamine N-acetyltransferase family protein [Hyphomicrobiaceae bacterium]